MKNYSFIGGFLFLILFLSGCANENMESENPAEIDHAAKTLPSFLKAEVSGGPLFGLATTPNNEILIADAGTGIVSMDRTTLVSLPGTVSIAPVGNGSMWAITWPLGNSEEDNGQGLHQIKKDRPTKIANFFAFEEEFNPDGQDINSNPYSVAAYNASFAVVADAGANDLLRVDNKGNIEVMAVFPVEIVSTQNIKSLVGCPNPADLCELPAMLPAQAVPTSVVIGPDGHYYVGELKGFPAPVGESNIWKIAPDASGAMCGSDADCVKVFDGGFTSIIDLAFSPDGRLFVAEFDEQSWFAIEALGAGAGGNIKACDTGTMECELIASGIPLLTAINFDKDGKLWAIQNGLIPDLAEVIEVAY